MPPSTDIVAHAIDVSKIPCNHKTFIHVAIIYRRGKILAIASNAIGSRSRGCGYSDRTIHAERAVLKKLGDMTKLRGAEMVVVRLGKVTTFVNSEPCHACKTHLTKCMREYGLRRVYYS